MRITSLKLFILALVAVALVVSATPNANATTITLTSGSTTVIVDYTLNSSTKITINSVSLNGDTSGGLKVIATDTTGTITSISGFTLNNPDCSSFSLNIVTCFGATSNGFVKTFPIVINGTGFTAGSTSLDLHAGAFTNNPNCSLKISFTVLTTNSTNGSFLSAPSATDCGGTPPPVPEPGTLGLLGTGLVGIAGLLRRRFLS